MQDKNTGIINTGNLKAEVTLLKIDDDMLDWLIEELEIQPQENNEQFAINHRLAKKIF